MPSEVILTRAIELHDQLRASRHNRGTIQDAWTLIADALDQVRRETANECATIVRGYAVAFESNDEISDPLFIAARKIDARFPKAKEVG